VILNGIPFGEMQELSRDASYSKIVMAGRFFPEKGFDLGIRSFKLVSEKYPEITLCILGNGPERRFLEELVRDLNLQDVIELPGVVNRSKLLMNIAGAFCVVIPTPESEAFGLLALESMSVGTPVIATRVGGLPEIIEDGIHGLLVEPKIQEIADAIERIYLDKNLAKKMALKGQDVVRNQFSMARFANQIKEEYLIALK
jgi:glycosyltransferase involved in cell wall biosynthesis